MIEIIPRKIRDRAISVPGSKSYTHRFFIASALSDGLCSILNPLQSEDTLATLAALKSFGINIKEKKKILIHGRSGYLVPAKKKIVLKNSGTSMRLLTSVAALCNGFCTLTGTKRLCERPISALIDALRTINVEIESTDKKGYPPVIIFGGKIKGGKVEIDSSLTSQYLSGLLLIAPYTTDGLNIVVANGTVSKPYIDITIDVMEKMGVSVIRSGYDKFIVKGSQVYKYGVYAVEPDCSNAGYFWAAAAITGAVVKLENIRKDTLQGDVKFVEVLAKMGCKTSYDTDGISVAGGRLHAIEIDMTDMPDMVPTLAVVAAFAKGATVIKNVSRLTFKESDRVNSVASELIKMGIEVEVGKENMIIKGGRPKGAMIDTYDDHRIAMSFAIAGLVTKGVVIKDEKCIEKSFPDFWDIFAIL